MTIRKRTCTLNIPYIYPMQILRKHSLNVRKRYLYLIALLFSCIVVLQVAGGNGASDLQGILRYSVLFVSNYLVWVFLIPYIYGSIRSFRDNERKWATCIVEILISFMFLLIFHLVITNVIYYVYLVAFTDLSIHGIWGDFEPFLLGSMLSRALDMLIIEYIAYASFVDWL